MTLDSWCDTGFMDTAKDGILIILFIEQFH